MHPRYWTFLLAVAGISLAACAPPQTGAAKDPFDWSIGQRVSTSDEKFLAVLETGQSNDGAGASPLHRVSIQTAGAAKKWGNHWIVWQSQVGHPPTLSWSDTGHLVITQEPYLVLEYEPEVAIGERVFAVDISIVRGGP